MPTDNSAEIAEIDAILQAGASRVSVDGQTVAYDFAELRRRRAELIAADDVTHDSKKRPRSSQINLGGSW